MIPFFLASIKVVTGYLHSLCATFDLILTKCTNGFYRHKAVLVCLLPYSIVLLMSPRAT